MTTPREDLTRMVEELRAQRDMLRVRLHLAGAEAREEWEALEKHLLHLQAKRFERPEAAQAALAALAKSWH